jgi:hypothetical protein
MLEKEGCQPNPTRWGDGWRDQQPWSHTPTSGEKKRKKLRLSELQKKIDEAAEEMQHITHDTEHQEYRHYQRDLR